LQSCARAKSAICRCGAGGDEAAASASIESLPQTESSRRPIQIFAAIFVVAAIAYSFRLGHRRARRERGLQRDGRRESRASAQFLRMPVLHDPANKSSTTASCISTRGIFGMSEISLRSLSVIFSLITLALVFALGREMFDDGTALAAATMWAFNPYAVVFAHTARMYPMFHRDRARASADVAASAPRDPASRLQSSAEFSAPRCSIRTWPVC